MSPESDYSEPNGSGPNDSGLDDSGPNGRLLIRKQRRSREAGIDVSLPAVAACVGLEELAGGAHFLEGQIRKN